MNADELLQHYEHIADAPQAVARLRRFILDLAVRGKLVPQDSRDESASELLKKIAAVKAKPSGDRQQRAVAIKAATPKSWSFAPPDGWVWVLFGDVVMSRDSERVPVSRDDRNARAKLFDYYGASGVIDKIDSYLFDKPLLLIGEDGANLVNRSTPIAFIARGKYWVNNHAHVLDAVSEELLRYLELFINATDLTSYITGTAQPKMNQAKMNSIPVALPPLAEQHRIVAKVDELMALCDRLEAARAQREAARDRLARSCLARLDTPDPETFGEDARFALDALPSLTARPDQIKQLRQTILNLAVRGKLSDHSDWTTNPTRLGNVASLQNGYAFKSEWFSTSGIRLVRNANVSHGTLEWSEQVRLPESRADEYERFRLYVGDVVLSLDRPFIVTGTKVARVSREDLPALLLQRVGRFVLSENVHPDYLYLWVTSPHFAEQIDPGRSNGVPHISSKQVENAAIFVPPLPEQHRIVAKVDELMALCDRLEASLTQADDHRRRLLEALLHDALEPVAALEEQAA